MRKKILIVDNSEMARKMLREVFWFYGYDADTVSIDKVLSELKTKVYDLIIVNCSMPDVNLKILTELIMSVSPHTSIIGISPSKETAEMGIEMIPASPLDIKRLIKRVSFMLNVPRPHP